MSTGLKEFLEVLKNPGVIVFITGLVGAVTYLFQDWRKRVSDRNECKRLLYEELLENVFGLFYVDTPLDRSKIVTKIEKSWLFGSDEVLKSCYKFLDLYDRTVLSESNIRKTLKKDEHLRHEFEENLALIFFQMRQDLRVRKNSKIDEEWAKKVLKIYKWGALLGE